MSAYGAGVAIKRIPVGVGGSAVDLRRILVGTGGTAVEVWSSATPMGIDKVGDVSIARNAWTPVSGWSPRSGYPGTVQQAGDDASLVAKSGTYTLTARVGFTSTNSGICRVAILVNGTTVTASPEVASPTATATVQHTLADGDLVSTMMFTDYFGASSTARTVLGGSANTYLRVDAA